MGLLFQKPFYPFLHPLPGSTITVGHFFCRTQNVLGEKGRRIRELTSVVQKRFGFAEGSVELYAEKVATRGLCAIAQAESLRFVLKH